jgi:hypothetical protein
VLKVDPSLAELEKKIAVPHVEVNTTTCEPLVMLPGYEGFHGVIAHDGNEAYQHGEHGDGHGFSSRAKVADLDDYKTWLDEENKVSKLARFRRLHDEFAKLSANVKVKDKRLHQHDDGELFHGIDPSMLNETHVSGLDASGLVKLEQKLVITIQKLEEEEKRQKKRDSHKADL